MIKIEEPEKSGSSWKYCLLGSIEPGLAAAAAYRAQPLKAALSAE